MHFLKQTFLAALLLLLCLPSGKGAAAQTATQTSVRTAARIAESVQNAYAKIESMRVDFKQTLRHKESGSVEKRSGLLTFKKPLLLRWENKKPSPELLLVGKDAIWNVFPDEEMACKYSLAMAEDSRSLVRVITGQARLDQDFDLEDEGVEGNLLSLRLYPKEALQSMVEALLWVEADSGLIKKIRVYDFYGNENEIEFGKQELDMAVKDALFSYKAPAGYLVEDRSQDKNAAPPKAFSQ